MMQIHLLADRRRLSSGLLEVVFEPRDSRCWWRCGVRYGTPFRTRNDGGTFERLANFPQNGGIAVDFSDHERRTILVGGHEQGQEVQSSADGGRTWANIGANLPAASSQPSGGANEPHPEERIAVHDESDTR